MAAFGPNAIANDTISFFNLLLVLLGVLYFAVVKPMQDKRHVVAVHGAEPGVSLVASQQAAAMEEGAPRMPVVENGTPHAPVKPGARSAYLDNVKVVLTYLVVLHHVACTFSMVPAFGYNIMITRGEFVMGAYWDNSFVTFAGWFTSFNQSFFMCLFFFISGLFTPSSFDKKGCSDFLKDKFIRLGVPVLVWYFVLGPLTTWGYASVIVGEGHKFFNDCIKNTWFYSGPPWFILWLLNFNVIYAFCQGRVPPVPAPTTAMLFLAAFAAGLVQFVVPTSNFIQVPMGLNQLSVTAVFFSLGAVAKRNAWLDTLPELNRSTVWFVRGMVLVLAGVLAIIFVDLHGTVTSGADVTILLPQLESQTAQVGFFMGVMSVLVSFAMLQLFQEKFPGTNRVLKWASSAAYTVYLIHPPFVNFGAYFYVKLLEVLGVHSLSVGLGPITTVVQTDNAMYMWLGFAFTSLVACGVFLWPVALLLARMPGFRQVL